MELFYEFSIIWIGFLGFDFYMYDWYSVIRMDSLFDFVDFYIFNVKGEFFKFILKGFFVIGNI